MRQEVKDQIVSRSIAGLIVGIILMIIAACFGKWYNPNGR
jgi:hypothetical protein